MEHKFYDEQIFGKVLVGALKGAIETMRPGYVSEFLWYWGKSNNHALYVAQDMRMADLLDCMRRWESGIRILGANQKYSDETSKPMLATMVEHQTKEISGSIKRAEECLTKEYPVIKHFKNNGQGEWENGLPKTVFEPQ